MFVCVLEWGGTAREPVVKEEWVQVCLWVADVVHVWVAGGYVMA